MPQPSAANLPAHQHTIDHGHGSAQTTEAGAHTHILAMGTSASAAQDAALVDVGRNAFGQYVYNSTPVQSAGEHVHVLNIPNHTGASGNGPGGNTAFDVMPPYLAARFIIKAA